MSEDFDADAHISIGGSSPLLRFANTTFTVTAWYKAPLSQFTIVSGGGSDGWSIKDAAPARDGMEVNFGGYSPVDYSAYTETAYTGGWYHIAVVMTTNTTDASGNSAKIYINGSLVPLDYEYKGDPYASSSSSVRIGRWNRGDVHEGTYLLKIDDVRIYDRGLTSGEIEAIYQEGL